MPGDGLVIALDQGSHASRAVLFDAAGNEVAQAHVPVATRHSGDDRVEHDPEELVRSLRTALQDACERRPGVRVVAAGLATQRSTIVAWSRGTGRALADAISWHHQAFEGQFLAGALEASRLFIQGTKTNWMKVNGNRISR